MPEPVRSFNNIINLDEYRGFSGNTALRQIPEYVPTKIGDAHLSATVSYTSSSAHIPVGARQLFREEIMAEQTREEIDAKIVAAESRIETKIVEISGEIKLMSAGVNSMSEKVAESSREQRSTRTTIIVTAIAVVIGLAAAIWQMQTGLLDAFQTGLTVKQAVEKTTKD